MLRELIIIVKEWRDRVLILSGGSGNKEKGTFEIYFKVELIGFSDGWSVKSEGEGEIENDYRW